MKRFYEFARREDGNATIDWVVITAGIVMLGIGVGVSVSTPAESLAQDIDSKMQTMAPGTY